MAIIAFMWFSRPYEGLRHDGVLYLGQVLLHSRVPVLSQDTFFAGGSQDSYSIYSDLMVPLYRQWGLLATHVGVICIAWLATLTAVLTLLRRFEPRGTLPLWGAVAFATLSPMYGGANVIGYTEPFVTARTFAEPLLLWSVVALLNGRKALTAVLLAGGALLHPLLTLPLMAVAWGYLVQSDRRWAWLLVAVPPAFAAAAAGVAPLDGLLKAYDAYWWSMVETYNHMVLVSDWTASEQLRIAVDVAILLACRRLHTSLAWQRLLLAIAVTVVASVILTGIGTDLLHNVLITQLQLWRAHWIGHLLAMGLAPWLFAQLWRRGGLWQTSAMAMALALLNGHTNQGHGVATAALWALVSLAAWRAPNVSKAAVRLSVGSIFALVLGLSFVHIFTYVQQWSWIYPQTAWPDGTARIAGSPLVALAVFALLAAAGKRGPLGQTAALGLGTLLLATAAFTWDQRPDLSRAVETDTATSHPFKAYIPANAQVYWPNELIPVWSLLERTSHFATQQGAGLLFNRGTALMFGPRRAMYQRIKSEHEMCRTGSVLMHSSTNWFACEMPDASRLIDVCKASDAPDFLVLPGSLPVAPLARWQPPAYRNAPQTYHLYACSQLKSDGAR